MKRLLIGLTAFILPASAFSQVGVDLHGSIFDNMNELDSVVIYQCHVENATPQLVTAGGQTLTGAIQRSTVTEKYVLHKSNTGYWYNYYTSALSVYPNRKFSGLKIREMPYWAFAKKGSAVLSDLDLKIFTSLERKGREAIEFDYPVTKYTTNQIIFKKNRDFRQLVINGNYLISRLLSSKPSEKFN